MSQSTLLYLVKGLFCNETSVHWSVFPSWNPSSYFQVTDTQCKTYLTSCKDENTQTIATSNWHYNYKVYHDNDANQHAAEP